MISSRFFSISAFAREFSHFATVSFTSISLFKLHLEELLVGVLVELGLLQIAFHRGGHRLLIQALAFQLTAIRLRLASAF